MTGKMRTLEGIAKKHGREAFLDAARYYTCHVRETVADTIYEMESRWYDWRNRLPRRRRCWRNTTTGAVF